MTTSTAYIVPEIAESSSCDNYTKCCIENTLLKEKSNDNNVHQRRLSHRKLHRPEKNHNNISVKSEISDRSSLNYRKRTSIHMDKRYDTDSLGQRESNQVKWETTIGAISVDNTYELSATVLQGVRIACFQSGGEKRLCLTEIMSTILDHIPLVDIERACDHLKIHSQHCTPTQIYILQVNKVISMETTSCNLITQANAERLCHFLLHSKKNDKKAYSIDHMIECSMFNSNDIVPVVHNCSGCVQGIAFISLYKNPNSLCIQCKKCAVLFSPPDFVCHEHKELLNRLSTGPQVCHWGLDSSKWRLYLNVDKTAVFLNKTQEQLGNKSLCANKHSTILTWKKKLTIIKDMFPFKCTNTPVDVKSDFSQSKSAFAHYINETKFDQQPIKTNHLNIPKLPFIYPFPFNCPQISFLQNQTFYDTFSSTNMTLSNPGAVAMEIGFDSLMRLARQFPANDEYPRNELINEIRKMRMICQHSTSFLFQTNNLLSHSVDQLAKENFILKRDFEQMSSLSSLRNAKSTIEESGNKTFTSDDGG